mgnify:CR=1 FL=1
MGITLANKITIARFVAIPVLVGTMLYYSPEREYIRWVALGIYLLAEATDVVDGYVARHLRQKTRAGSILDPLADKLLFLTTLVCLYKISWDFEWPVRLPLWLVIAFFTREVFIVIGALVIEIKRGGAEIRPNIFGKATAFLQVICVTAVFLQFSLTIFIWWLALTATVISGIIYMREGIKALNDDHR